MPESICHWCFRRSRTVRVTREVRVRLWSDARWVTLVYAYCSKRCRRAHVAHS